MNDKTKKKICSICKKEIDKQYSPISGKTYDEGHNAQPINNGRCCSFCNVTKVIPARIREAYNIDEKGGIK